MHTSKRFFTETRKRKLEYGDGNEIPEQLEKSHKFGQRGELSVSRLADWDRAVEGFSGFSTIDKSKPVRRRSLQKKHPQKYTISMSCDSESETEVENAITWSSSDEDSLSPKKDVEVNSRNKSKSKQGHIWKKRDDKVPSGRSKQATIDVQESDDEAVDEIKPSVAEADLIEDTDSRSSFTFSNSCSSRTQQKENIHEEDSADEFIQTLSSVETPASSQDKKGKVKASDWVKSLDLKTPSKQSPSVTITDDSAKKKKKYKRNGLADQLYKLQIREKSSVRVWNHQSTSENKVSSKSVLLKVQEFETLYSLQIARCKEVVITDDEHDSNNDDVYALFTSEMAEDMNITAGSLVRVFPPWQKLKLQSLQQGVLLCTYYIKLEGRENITEQDQPTSRHSMKWACPCVTGLVKNYRQCPAFQYPCIPGITLLENKSIDYPCGPNPEHSLCTIQATQSSGTTVSLVSDSILDSIDRSSVQSGISFRALVHRVFCKTVSDTEKRYSLLVEDSHGIMCEIQVPEDADLFNSTLQNAEGNAYIFSGLQVLTRITRDRDPGLFSMIDSVWSGSCTLAVSEESQTPTNSNILPPAFCYNMTEHSRPGIDFKITESSSQVSMYRKTQLITLQCLSQLTVDLTRVTARVNLLARIYQKDLKAAGNPEFSSLLFIRDSSLCVDEYKVVKVKDGCVLQDDLHHDIIIRDILWSNGSLVGDCYSQFLPFSDLLLERFHMDIPYTNPLRPFCVPNLQDAVEPYNLIAVRGTISEIDEDSAFSLEVCDKCDSDKLAEKSSTREVVCLNCKEVIKQPRTKMKMEVYITPGFLTPYKWRVDLLEETIQSVLPEEDNDDEGYDIGSVLNCEVGTLTCVVLKKSRNEVLLKEIKLMT